ncbi:MAG: S8 family serine peptidase [Nostocaceae cyanobacterium]|nr:S8 family serine peptidase [Nostocaceae cyanobacterium]
MSGFNLSNGESESTGKYLVLFRKDHVNEGIRSLSNFAGITSIARASDFTASAVNRQQLNNTENLILDNLGVGVITLDPQQLHSLGAASIGHNPMLAIEPERVVYALPSIGLGELEPKISHTPSTWGLEATKVIHSPFSGRGVKIAVLDTGLDLNHPDFKGRKIISKSFVDNEEVQDEHGHGTHCVGIACGSHNTPLLPRYGIAYDAEIYVGKVLDNKGKGTDGQILAGIQWAISNGCQIVSMSLGASILIGGQQYSRVFETAARRALQNGTLIVAAAGNDSDRTEGIHNPISHPANCPSIMAVSAVNSQFQVADFCNRASHTQAKQIDIAAPGVNIHSTWLMTTKYKTDSGTSMAAPHVAGIAALYVEATKAKAKGRNLWNLLVKQAQKLPLDAVDVGCGLVQVINDTGTLDTDKI